MSDLPIGVFVRSDEGRRAEFECVGLFRGAAGYADDFVGVEGGGEEDRHVPEPADADYADGFAGAAGVVDEGGVDGCAL